MITKKIQMIGQRLVEAYGQKDSSYVVIYVWREGGLSSQFAGHIWATKMSIDVDTQDVREEVSRDT